MAAAGAVERQRARDCPQQGHGESARAATGSLNPNTSSGTAVTGTAVAMFGPAIRPHRRFHTSPAPPSPDVGMSTPPTVILTPVSQERSRRSDTRSTGIGAGSSSTRARAPAIPTGSLPPPRDSLAAAVLAAGVAAAESAAAEAERAREEAKAAEMQPEPEPTRGQELEAAKGQREIGDALEGQERQRGSTESVAATRGYESPSGGGSSSNSSSRSGSISVGHVRPASSRHGAPRTMAEMERHKRNRAERLRAYGCTRTLYPRICPLTESGSPALEEAETQQWVESLRVNASLRGESLMAACSQSVSSVRTADIEAQARAEARASRTADVSDMEGSDGLLHCAVLKGDHPLAARAAQFLVDKRGSNVNSQDKWGR